MKVKPIRPSVLNEGSKQVKKLEKKIKSAKKLNEISKYEINNSAYQIIASSIKNNINNFGSQHEIGALRSEDAEFLQMPYFTDKYLLRDEDQQHLKQQMKMVLNRKINQIQSLRIYRDQLKFISRNDQQNQSVKISVQALKQKAKLQEKLSVYKFTLQKEIRNSDRQLQILSEYQKFMQNSIDITNSTTNNNILDISKQQEIMLKNLQSETDLLIKQLAEQQKRNNRQIKQIQDEIMQYRIMIKEKQDHLRNLKAKICTLYIKLHSRNKSRTNSKSKDRNMSLSVKKFNVLNHNTLKQAYIGNNAFKSYSKQIIQKVTSDQELVKIKFFLHISRQTNDLNKSKQQLFFQCFYKNRQGQIHDFLNQQLTIDNDLTRDKLSNCNQKFEEIYVKYLLSMKFFYKSKIVGVQCRVKTDKGNKHVQIGNCDPHVQYELLTLVNKKIITLGSFWHGKEMIGVSVWYSDRQATNEENKYQDKGNRQKQAYDQYYS